MTGSASAVDPATPDGPAPHAPPMWSYLCLESPDQARAIEGVAHVTPLAAGATGQRAAAEATTAFVELMMAPYLAAWKLMFAGTHMFFWHAGGKSAAPD